MKLISCIKAVVFKIQGRNLNPQHPAHSIISLLCARKSKLQSQFRAQIKLWKRMSLMGMRLKWNLKNGELWDLGNSFRQITLGGLLCPMMRTRMKVVGLDHLFAILDKKLKNISNLNVRKILNMNLSQDIKSVINVTQRLE